VKPPSKALERNAVVGKQFRANHGTLSLWLDYNLFEIHRRATVIAQPGRKSSKEGAAARLVTEMTPKLFSIPSLLSSPCITGNHYFARINPPSGGLPASDACVWIRGEPQSHIDQQAQPHMVEISSRSPSPRPAPQYRRVPVMERGAGWWMRQSPAKKQSRQLKQTRLQESRHKATGRQAGMRKASRRAVGKRLAAAGWLASRISAVVLIRRGCVVSEQDRRESTRGKQEG